MLTVTKTEHATVPTHVSVLRHVAITFYLVRVCAVLTVHSVYRHQLHGTICLHIFVVVPLCRSFFYLNSSLTFSSPLSLLSSIIPYSPHTLFRFNFYFYLVCLFLSLFDVIMFGAPELLWWGALANLWIWLIWLQGQNDTAIGTQYPILCLVTKPIPNTRAAQVNDQSAD